MTTSKIFEQIIRPIIDELSEKPRILSRYGGREELEKKALEYLGGFYTQFDENMYRGFAKQCEESLFPALFTMVRGHEILPGTIDMIKGPLSSCPVIFTPNHDSNLDGMTHGIFFYQNRIKHPKITAGANLCKSADGTPNPQVTATLKALNVVVVDRTLLARDLLYLKLFREYFNYTLTNGENHCFYIESGRSYSGSVKVGAVSAMLNWTLETDLPLVAIVPAGVSYTRIFEDSALFRCHATGEKMAETNLMEEFSRGSAILGSDSPVHLTVAPPILIRRSGDSILIDHLSAALALSEEIDLETAMEATAAEVEEFNASFAVPSHKLHDLVYESMLSARPVLCHYVTARAIADLLHSSTEYSEDEQTLQRAALQQRVGQLLTELSDAGRNLTEKEPGACLEKGLATLEKYSVCELKNHQVLVRDPNLCTFYGNKVPLVED